MSLLSFEIIDAVSEFVFLVDMSHCWPIMAYSLIKAKSFLTNAQGSGVLRIKTSRLTIPIRSLPRKSHWWWPFELD